MYILGHHKIFALTVCIALNVIASLNNWSILGEMVLVNIGGGYTHVQKILTSSLFVHVQYRGTRRSQFGKSPKCSNHYHFIRIAFQLWQALLASTIVHSSNYSVKIRKHEVLLPKRFNLSALDLQTFSWWQGSCRPSYICQQTRAMIHFSTLCYWVNSSYSTWNTSKMFCMCVEMIVLFILIPNNPWYIHPHGK